MKNNFYPKVSFEEKKEKMQDFYDNWVKPMKEFMSQQALLDLEELVKEYSLIK